MADESPAPRPPLPPFDEAGARQMVQAAEDAWNTRDAQRVAGAYTPDSVWRNRSEFVSGRAEIEAFLTRKWEREHDYALRKSLWAFEGNRIAASSTVARRRGALRRSCGNEAGSSRPGYMRRRGEHQRRTHDEADRRIHGRAESERGSTSRREIQCIRRLPRNRGDASDRTTTRLARSHLAPRHIAAAVAGCLAAGYATARPPRRSPRPRRLVLGSHEDVATRSRRRTTATPTTSTSSPKAAIATGAVDTLASLRTHAVRTERPPRCSTGSGCWSNHRFGATVGEARDRRPRGCARSRHHPRRCLHVFTGARAGARC
jgi:hypothetical protein